jgi:hypothetical protein
MLGLGIASLSPLAVFGGSIGGLFPSEGVSLAVLIGIAGSAYALFVLSIVRRRR